MEFLVLLVGQVEAPATISVPYLEEQERQDREMTAVRVMLEVVLILPAAAAAPVQ